jgi:hypothetical protein
MKRSGSATACSCMGREETLGWGHDRLEKKQRSAAHRALADAARWKNPERGERIDNAVRTVDVGR